MVCFRHLKMRLATVNQKMIFDRLQKDFLNGIPDSLNESQCNSMVIVLLRSASVIGPEIVISELFSVWIIFLVWISLSKRSTSKKSANDPWVILHICNDSNATIVFFQITINDYTFWNSVAWNSLVIYFPKKFEIILVKFLKAVL